MNRVAVVSAAASGIGAAVVDRLAASGWRVIAVDQDAARLAGSAAEWTVTGDVLEEQTWQQVDALAATAGEVDRFGLVAGVGWATFRPSREMSDEEWLAAFGINFLSAVKPVRALLPRLEAAGRGAIVTIGSVSGIRSEPTTPAYCAMKSALEAWSAALALELARTTVRVNCVLPGVTDTEGLRGNLTRKGQTLDALEERARNQPRGSLVQPEEVAALVAFLVSDDASGLIGSSVVIDGGLSRRSAG